MEARSTRLFPRLAAPLLVLPLLSWGVLASSRAPERPAASPRQLVAVLATLEEEERFGEVLERIAPEKRELYVFVSWLGAAFDAAAAEEEVATAYRAIVAEHRLDEDWLSEATEHADLRPLAEKALRDVDLSALLHDLASFRLEHGCFGVAFGFRGDLGELHVEEDWALARIERSEFELVRSEGAWFWSPLPELDE